MNARSRILAATLALGCAAAIAATMPSAGASPAKAAPGPAIPWVYAPELAEWTLECVRPGGKDCEALGRIVAESGDTASAAAFARALRKRFRLRPEFDDPALLKKARFLAYLDTGSLLKELPFYAPDSLVAYCLPLRDSVRAEKAALLAALPLPATGLSAAGWELRARLVFATYLGAVQRIDSGLWDGVTRGFREYDLEQAAKGTASGGDLIRRRKQVANRFETLLRDAVWGDTREPAAVGFSLSSFLLGGSDPRSPADSAALTERIRSFGARNSGLAFRVDPSDSATWNDPRQKRLQTLIETEKLAMIRLLSREQFDRLDSVPDVDLKLRFEGDRYPDFIGLFKYRLARRALLQTAAPVAGTDPGFFLPFLTGKAAEETLGSATPAAREAGFQRWERTLDPRTYNYYRLGLMPFISVPFKGSTKELRAVVEERRLL